MRRNSQADLSGINRMKRNRPQARARLTPSVAQGKLHQINARDAVHQGPWDVAVRGSSALRAAILSMFHEELANYSHEEVATILWDLTKNMTPLTSLSWQREPLTLNNYPVMVFALRIQMHMAPRTIKGPRPLHNGGHSQQWYHCRLHPE